MALQKVFEPSREVFGGSVYLLIKLTFLLARGKCSLCSLPIRNKTQYDGPRPDASGQMRSRSARSKQKISGTGNWARRSSPSLNFFGRPTGIPTMLRWPLTWQQSLRKTYGGVSVTDA